MVSQLDYAVMHFLSFALMSWKLNNKILFLLNFVFLEQTAQSLRNSTHCFRFGRRFSQSSGGSREGAIGAIAPPKTYVNNFIYHTFVQFEKQHSPYKAILPSTVLTQQCCEVHFISLISYSSNALTTKYYWKRPP